MKFATASGGCVLHVGESISTYNPYLALHLALHLDGSLRLTKYNNGSIGRELWEIESSGGSGYKVKFQSDGNLVTYNGSDRAT